MLGAAIIFVLASYAGWLLSKLHHQTKLQQKLVDAAITKRNNNIIESVNTITLATLQNQCDFSEAAIRLYMIMEHLQGKMAVEFSQRFPALYELYDLVKDMPRADDRKALAKKERMKFDLIRMEGEARLQANILNELQEILIFTGAKQAFS